MLMQDLYESIFTLWYCHFYLSIRSEYFLFILLKDLYALHTVLMGISYCCALFNNHHFILKCINDENSAMNTQYKYNDEVLWYIC